MARRRNADPSIAGPGCLLLLLALGVTAGVLLRSRRQAVSPPAARSAPRRSVPGGPVAPVRTAPRTTPRTTPAVRPATRRAGPPPRIQTRIEDLDLPALLRQIDGFVRAFDFELALENLRRIHGLAARETDRAWIERRIEEVGAYSALLDGLVASIRSGALHGHRLQIEGLGELAVTLADANRTGFRAAVGDRGHVGERWAGLSYAARWELLRRVGWSAAQWLALARLSADVDAPELAERSLLLAWRAGARDAAGRALTALRGVTPAGGWAVHRGRFVTAEERRRLEAGLVLYRGRWVTPQERRRLARAPATPPPAEQPRDFARAWVERSENWRVRTNVGRGFARRAVAALESAYAAQRRFFGKEPRGSRRMTMLVFRTYEDYRAYCKKLGRTSQLNAAGFAPSEPRTACAWDKHKDRGSLLRTVVHEATHLYHQLAIGGDTPSWLAEGMATYFEGFRARSDGRLTFDHRPRERLRTLQSALRAGRTIPFARFRLLRAADLLATDSHQALVFYAQAWGWFYFLHHAPDARLRDAFRRYREKHARGARPDLERLLGVGLPQLEQQFERFIGRL